MKKKIEKIILVLVMLLGCCLNYGVQATTTDQKQLEDLLKNETSIDVNNLDVTQIVEAYQELTKTYTNKELADMVEENKEAIEKHGISPSVISAGTKILRTVDEKELNRILTQDINLEEIKEKIKAGYTQEEAIEEVQKQMSTTDRLMLVTKLLFTSSIIKIVALIGILLLIYDTILKWIIFHKAGKHGWASLIPIYRQVTELKVCQMSPWWLVLLLIPILGWFIFTFVWIVSRFKLAESFGKGIGFGVGLVFLGILFKSIIAFNPNIRIEQ